MHQLFERVDDVVVARLLVDRFESDLDLCKAFPGAHLRALETVKRSHIRYAKARRYGVLARTCGGIAIDLVGTVVSAALRIGRATSAHVRAVRRRAAYVKSVRNEAKVICLPDARRSASNDAEPRIRRVA
ncbi:hypothetical protein ASF43_12470 [Pseudorhodoferax sp. Leaf267]|nr:hypothetical protein ASF43_12470 [Pseudorhodoferax sp. Leaf267]